MSSEGVGFGPFRLALRSEAVASGTLLAPESARLGEHHRALVPVRRARARAGTAALPVSLADPPAVPPASSGDAAEREALARRLVERLLDALDSLPAASTERITETIQRALAVELSGLRGAVSACRQTAGLGRAELARITDYIDRNIDRSIELVELAALIKVSRFHFSRLFKRSTGTTALAYVEARRILHAQRLLAETDLPIAEVALMTGFADQSHFTRRFRERLGSTPAAFAREKGRRRSAQRPA